VPNFKIKFQNGIHKVLSASNAKKEKPSSIAYKKKNYFVPIALIKTTKEKIE